MLFHGHAIEQFITRYDRTLNYEQALALLEGATRYEAEPTRTGERYWDVPELGVRLVVKHWRGGEWDGEQVCITVVKGRYCRLLTDVERELLEDAVARGASARDRSSAFISGVSWCAMCSIPGRRSEPMRLAWWLEALRGPARAGGRGSGR